MNEEIFNCEILEAIFGTKLVDSQLLKNQIKSNSSNFLAELESYRIFDEDETKIIDVIENNYEKYSRFIIDQLSSYYFQMPIDMAIATKQQETINSLFLNVAERLGFDSGLQAQINSDLENIANKLNRRFTFDTAALIHLIEASKGSNIQLEEGFQRRSSKNKRQILRQKEDGSYYLAEITGSRGIDTYTLGNSIPTINITKKVTNIVDGISIKEERTMTKTSVDSNRNIYLPSYPGAKDILETNSTDVIMKQVMKNLFDNLELCVDTYKFFYTNDEGAAIRNNAILADDSEFEFYYRINKRNLSHLLGIQRGEILSETTKRYFAKVGKDGTVYYPVNENSSSFNILKALLKNKERIIADGGLVNDNGKIYQLFPWKKIILKTSSFMRGDFFKTCFCLVKLDRGINARNEKFASVSSTKYDENMTCSKFDARKVLRDLINIARKNKDFIFRTFIEDFDRNGNFLGYIPQSIDTGKAENIVTNNRERIQTLNRFRNALQGSGADGGSVVKSIENENMGKRIFSPVEQALTHINISSGLNVGMQISKEALAFEQSLKDMLNNELDKDIQKILTPTNKKRK